MFQEEFWTLVLSTDKEHEIDIGPADCLLCLYYVPDDILIC